jgi:chloride channel 3/4/5
MLYVFDQKKFSMNSFKYDLGWASRDLQYNSVNTEECAEWFTWPQVFGSYKRGAGEFFLSYIMYIFWSTIFATFAVLLVKVFAPYACGSGIPEVRKANINFIQRFSFCFN